jgi:hypothetical protein
MSNRRSFLQTALSLSAGALASVRAFASPQSEHHHPMQMGPKTGATSEKVRVSRISNLQCCDLGCPVFVCLEIPFTASGGTLPSHDCR